MATTEQFEEIKACFSSYEDRRTQHRKEMIDRLRTAELTDAELDQLEDLILKN